MAPTSKDDAPHTAKPTPRIGIAIMAKAPLAGHSKTRLCGELSPEDAARLAGAMLADRCTQIASLGDAMPAVAMATAAVPTLVPEGFELIVQSGEGLGNALLSASEFFAARGLPSILVDSDSPTLPLSYFEQATDALCGDCDVVIGPSADGGYYLIGFATPQPALLSEMPWSTPEVTRITLERAKHLGLVVHLLPTWNDIDTPADLAALQASLFHAWWPSRTAAFLRERELARVQAVYGDGSPQRRLSNLEASELSKVPWQRLQHRQVYGTPWLSIREDRVRLPTGAITTYSVVDCGECVGILPFVDDETVLLIRQFRYIAGRPTWEMPTGGVERGEPHGAAATRELAEEAQVTGTLTYLGSYHTSKSVMDETAHLYLARDLAPVTAQCEETEFLRVRRVPFAQALEMVLSGEIVDSMTIIAILRVAHNGGLRGIENGSVR